MKDDARTRLRAMLDRFVRGEDRSVRYANEIEELLSRDFRNTPIYDELVEDLATYRPGGGQFLIDEPRLARKFEFAIREWLSDPL
jgi:hypothetical protein